MIDYSFADSRRLLARTPAVLAATFDGLPAGWADLDDGPNTWSARQVLGHLVDAEDELWVARMNAILHGDGETPFTPFDRDRHLTRFAKTDVASLLELFATKRRATIDALDAIDVSDATLARTAVHPEFGKVTLRQLLSTWTAHDLVHLTQISRTLARQYSDAVGPWRAYMRTLQ